MIRLVTPHLWLDHVRELDLPLVRALGLQGLLLDLDNTLKDHDDPELPAASIAWIDQLRDAGIALCLLSNGRGRRVGRLAASLALPHIARANKPLPFGCHSGLRRLGLPARQVGIVGDQVFADVLAGRLAGITAILVRPTSPHEPWFTRLKRPPERWVLRQLHHRILRPAQLMQPAHARPNPTPAPYSL